MNAMNTITGNRRMLAIIAALLLAALATAALLSYVRGVEQRAVDGRSLVSVIVAADEIPAGTSAETAGSRGLLAREGIPRRLVADGAVTALSQLQGTVAATTIRRGEQIVAGRFVAPAQISGALPIPADRQAMSLEVDLPHGVGGFVRPGSHVSIIAKFEVKGPNRDTFDLAAYLIQDATVLAVDSHVVAVPGAAASKKDDRTTEETAQDRMTLTLALLPADAPKLALALTDGVVFVTLLPPGQKPVTVPARTFDNEFK